MVSLEWQTDEADRLQIVWRETGGPKVKPPTRRGFGTLMIEQGLAADLEGSAQLEFGPEGVVCRIEALCKGSGQ
jgi:two-component sensor histidine kinase